MCVSNLHIYIVKDIKVSPDEDFFYKISTNIITGENCSYIHENRLSYCGESDLDDCKSCKRQGCTVIECGEEDLKNNINFVRNLLIFFII